MKEREREDNKIEIGDNIYEKKRTRIINFTVGRIFVFRKNNIFDINDTASDEKKGNQEEIKTKNKDSKIENNKESRGIEKEFYHTLRYEILIESIKYKKYNVYYNSYMQEKETVVCVSYNVK